MTTEQANDSLMSDFTALHLDERGATDLVESIRASLASGVPPADWSEGIFTAPHAVCFDAMGNLYIMDWNASGRISKLRRVKD